MIYGLAILISTFIVFSSCSKTEKGSSPAVDYIAVSPKKAAHLKNGVETRHIDHDSRGYPKVSFILRMDLLDLPKKVDDKLELPKCMQPLLSDMELGELRCVKGSVNKAKLTVSHVDQLCYRDPLAEHVKAKSSINLGKCKASELLIYRFSPHIDIDTEAR